MRLAFRYYSFQRRYPIFPYSVPRSPFVSNEYRWQTLRVAIDKQIWRRTDVSYIEFNPLTNTACTVASLE